MAAGQVHPRKIHSWLDYPLAKYATEDRAKEVLESFINDMFDTPWTMIGRYAFPTE
jgi:hypothetical protein